MCHFSGFWERMVGNHVSGDGQDFERLRRVRSENRAAAAFPGETTDRFRRSPLAQSRAGGCRTRGLSRALHFSFRKRPLRMDCEPDRALSRALPTPEVLTRPVPSGEQSPGQRRALCRPR
jgi:hypothetical protein